MQQKGKPLTAMVYEQVYSQIINGAITSNDILTESSLVSRLNVSKSPVREALILLCEENVLRSIPRMGYKVVQILPGEVEKLAEARFALEPFMLKKAWDRIGSMELKKLEDAWKRSKEDEIVNTTVQDNWRRNIEFHLMLGAMAGNEYLLSMLERTLRTCARASTQYFLHVRGIPRGEKDLHNDLLDAVRQQDLGLALSVLGEDIRQIV